MICTIFSTDKQMHQLRDPQGFTHLCAGDALHAVEAYVETDNRYMASHLTVIAEGKEQAISQWHQKALAFKSLSSISQTAAVKLSFSDLDQIGSSLNGSNHLVVPVDDRPWIEACPDIARLDPTDILTWSPYCSVDADNDPDLPDMLIPDAITYMCDDVKYHSHHCPASFSTGFSAASSLEAAQLESMLDLILQDAVALWWYAGRKARTLNMTNDQADQFQTWVIDQLPLDLPDFLLLDISTDIQIPCVAAIFFSPITGRAMMGFHAHPDPVIAAQKATAQAFVQLTIKGQEQIQSPIFPRRELCPQFQNISEGTRMFETPSPDRLAQRKACIDQLRAAGFEPWYLDLSHKHSPSTNIRLLIPGLQSCNPQWVSSRMNRQATRQGWDPKVWATLPPITNHNLLQLN